MRASDFMTKWEMRRDELDRLHAHVDGAILCQEVLGDFAAVTSSQDEEHLTLREGAALSGYSADHLARLIRQGTLPNAGRRGAPRVRRGDLPRRPKAAVAPTTLGAYDVVADARKLVSRRRGGAHGTS